VGRPRPQVEEDAEAIREFGAGLDHGRAMDPSWDNNSETRSRERSFEVASRGGYARTVVGRVA
jgi:hypothetical protein